MALMLRKLRHDLALALFSIRFDAEDDAAGEGKERTELLLDVTAGQIGRYHHAKAGSTDGRSSLVLSLSKNLAHCVHTRQIAR